MEAYDFSGWVTRNDLKCTDGRIIRRDAFKHNDGEIVPLVWNHDHSDPFRVVGNIRLQNRTEGVYGYGSFNDSTLGKTAKLYVQHGDITKLSIYANQLQQQGPNVLHGEIKEVSLVLAGANPGAYIENVIRHSDDGEMIEIADEAYILTGEEISLYHAEDESKEEKKVPEQVEKKPEGEKTIAEIIDTMNEEQKTAMYYVVGEALKENESEGGEAKHSDISEGGDATMKHNVFDPTETKAKTNVLTHADQEAIISLAKQSNVGSWKQALQIYAEANDIIQHSDDNVGIFEDYGVLFPELELLKKGEPDTIYQYDQSWIGPALKKIHKSPFSRIRTRHADARLADLKAKGYQNKGDQKTVMGQIKMISRETTPQTIYIKDALHRDDIVDITDFSIVEYQWTQMRRIMDETMVLAAFIGDQREDTDPDKISEDHIRPIWKDNEEYTIHYDVDIDAAEEALQGTDTNKHFGENYIYAEAIITAALYSREKFKGTGTPDFYCTPHLVNVMLLARDMNGRRIYDSKSDLTKALNCNSIIEVEQFEGLTRTVDSADATEHSVAGNKELLGIFVNLNDYTFGSTKGGEITRFEDFDMDFNLKKFMLEARLSGSLYKLKSAIALEKPVAAG